MICPTCRGDRKFGALGYNYDRGSCRPVVLPCFDCGQTGTVDDRHTQWKAAGTRLKDARIARRETLRMFCKRTGIDPTLRSAQERGFADPAAQAQ
jgi:hypothetical protein